MALIRLLLGIALLIMGRRLFWLFLGGVGFVFGFDFAERMIHGQSHSIILMIALFSGALGAMVAIFLQKFAVVGGGFVAGGYLLIELLKILGVRTGDYHWFLFIAGGLVGAFLMSVCVRLDFDYSFFSYRVYSYFADLSFRAAVVEGCSSCALQHWG